MSCMVHTVYTLQYTRSASTTVVLSTHCKENPIYIFLFWGLRGFSPNFHIHVYVSDLYIPCNRIGRSWKYINPSQIYECRNWEIEHYNSGLEITVSFLGIHKWESDIYIGFSPALHLQCTRPQLSGLSNSIRNSLLRILSSRFFAIKEPIWVGDLESEAKNRFSIIWNLISMVWFFTAG